MGADSRSSRRVWVLCGVQSLMIAWRVWIALVRSIVGCIVVVVRVVLMV